MNGNGGNFFWKIAGPVFAMLLLSSIGIAGKLLDQRLVRIENDIQKLLDMHLHVTERPE